MGIEWFRDLSITILGLVASVVLVFMSVIMYRMYRNGIVDDAVDASGVAGVNDTVNMVQAVIEPLFPIMALIQGIRGGIKGFGKMFKKEFADGGNRNE